MGDTTIAQDLLDGVADALADVGDTRTMRIITEGALNINDPGAGRPRTPEEFPVEALLYDFEDDYVNETTIKTGDRQALLSITSLTNDQKSGIIQGSKVIDGSDNYTVVGVQKIETAGIVVTMILHIRGA